MNSWRAVIAGCAAVALLGCDKSKSEPPAVPAVSGLAAIPANARAVVGIDLSKLAESKLARRALEQLYRRDADLKAWAERIAADCQLTVGESVTSVLLALGDKSDESLLVATGTFSENKLAACVGTSLAKDGGRLVTQKVGQRAMYRTESGAGKASVWFAVSAPSTLVVSASGEWLKAALGTGRKIASDPTMTAIVGRADKTATLWAAGLVPKNVGAGLAKATNGQATPPKSMTVRAMLDSGVDVTLTAELASDAEATALVAQGKAQIGMIALALQKDGLGRLVNRVEFSSKSNYLELRLQASEDELADLLTAIDSAATSLQNPAPVGPGSGSSEAPADPKGEQGNGDRDPASNRQPPIRQ